MRFHLKGHPILSAHVDKVSDSEIALPSVVIAELLNGRCEYVLKAEPEKAAQANELLLETLRTIRAFQVVVFDQACADVMAQLQARHKRHKRHADLMIAAMAIAGGHVLVTRNRKDFADLLPALQMQNWIDDTPIG